MSIVPSKVRRAVVAVVAVGVGAAGVVALTSAPSDARGVVAVAELRDANGAWVGRVTFVRLAGLVVADADVALPEGVSAFRGFHVHANDVDSDGDGKAADGCVAPAFTSVDGHWDDGTHTHGAHRGDMPPLVRAEDGKGHVKVALGTFTPGEVIGRAIVVHAGPDNFANIPERYVTGPEPTMGADPVTLATGDSGGRYACGVIVPARR